MVNSLLSAIVRADGDALVMHVGEKPYVVAAAGPVELSSRALTVEAVTGVLTQLLPGEARQALEELGAVEHELTHSLPARDERFTVVAARGGDDIWIEIRRYRAAEPQPLVQPAPVTAPPSPPVPAEASRRQPVPRPEPVFEPEPELEPEFELPLEHEPAAGRLVAQPVGASPPAAAPVPVVTPPPAGAPQPVATSEPVVVASPAAAQEPVAALPPMAARPPVAEPGPTLEAVLDLEPAIMLPRTRTHITPEPPPHTAVPARMAGLDRLLRLAAARGATTLYVLSQAKPSIRVDGEMAGLDGEAELNAQQVEALIMDLAPERTREALRSGEAAEWVAEVPDVGRIRCLGTRDHRGPGGIFRLIAARPASAEQLGLSKEIQGLLDESEGLVLVAGPRASGKSTLLCAFVDLINRGRGDYVITIENQINHVHENRRALVSQREVRGGAAEMAAVARAALRENPDVLVIDDLRSPEIVGVALDAVETGRLVIGAVNAHTSAAAIGRLIEQSPTDGRARVQATLAEWLRGVVAQALLRKTGEGRVAARELLLNTPSMADLLSEGRVAQIPLAIDSGRKHGMVPLNDALVAFVQSGIVDAREAYRKAYERQAFLSVLRREGLDTSFVERLA